MIIRTAPKTHDMWCDRCRDVAIKRGEKYSKEGDQSFCQDCEPIISDKAGAQE